MKQIDIRFRTIIMKWITVAAVVLSLWFAKIFLVLFILVLLLVQEFNKFIVWLFEPTQAGAKSYWATYWTYWMIVYVGLLIAFSIWYFTWYRHKRPNLVVGGGREGRVLWIKGVRRGLVYDVWDAIHYMQWKLKKNRLAPIPRSTSDTSDGEVETTWPDPLSIQLGRPTSLRIIYYSRPWSLKVHRLLVPAHVNLLAMFFTVRLPEGYMVNRPDPLFPGTTLLAFVGDRPEYAAYEKGRTQTQIIHHLDEVKDAVQRSAAANPQLIHRDYEDGSFPILNLEKEEETTID